jgi:hypothetical protein
MAKPANMRPMALMLIPQLIGIGLSANMAERALAAAGLSYRRITFLQDWRNLQGLYGSIKGLAAVQEFDEVPYRVMAEGDWNKARRYRARGTYRIENQYTGDYEDRFFTTYYNRNKPKAIVSDDFARVLNKNPSRPDWEVVNVTVETIEHKRGWQYL